MSSFGIFVVLGLNSWQPRKPTTEFKKIPAGVVFGILTHVNISKVKFVTIFIIVGFVFLFISTSLLGSTGVRGFPKHPDSFLGTASPIAWKNGASTIIFPIKIILIGPLLLSTDFLRDDPPPPFIGIYLIFYWTILASAIHSLLGKVKHSSQPLREL
jgi:hypothetical protein